MEAKPLEGIPSQRLGTRDLREGDRRDQKVRKERVLGVEGGFLGRKIAANSKNSQIGVGKRLFSRNSLPFWLFINQMK